MTVVFSVFILSAVVIGRRYKFRRVEEEIVVALGIERRVEVDEVNGFIREVLAKDVEVVAVEKLVH